MSGYNVNFKITLTDKTVTLLVSPTESITHIKRRIRESVDSIEQMNLTIEGDVLREYQTLGDNGVEEDDEVCVDVVSMEVWLSVKLPLGGVHRRTVEVYTSDSINELRREVDELQNSLGLIEYSFVFQGEPMVEHQSFKWHGVCPGDTIDVVAEEPCD